MKRIYVLLLLGCIILPAGVAECQENDTTPLWIKTHGNLSLTGNYSNRKEAFGYKVPPSWLVLQGTGIVEVFGIPLSVSGLYSTMQNDQYQAMNHLSLKFDARSLLASKVQKPGFRFMRRFDVFEIGRARPSYSPLMLSMVPLTGINIQVRFGAFYTAFAGGDLQREISTASFGYNRYRQTMYFGRLGLGKEGANHIYLQVLQAEDRESSLVSDLQTKFIRQPDTLIHLTDTFFIPADTLLLTESPKESLLTGIGGGLSFFRKKLTLEGEVVGGLHTANTRSDTLGGDLLPVWALKLYTPRLSTSLSYAARTRTMLNLRTTKLQLSWEMAGPGFQSPGINYIRQDYQSVQASGSQYLFRRRFSLQPQIRWYRDNLSKAKQTTTTTFIWGITALWQPVKLPYVSIHYAPHSQVLESEGGNISNTAKVMVISTGKNYHIGKNVTCFTGITWSNQQMKALLQGDATQFTGNSLTLQQSIIPRIPLSFNLNIMGYHQDFGSREDLLRQFGCSMQYRCKKILTAGLGVRYNDRNGEERRTGISGSLTADFKQWGQIRVLAEPATYTSLTDPGEDFSEYSIRITYSKRW
ncbi:MAG TPA: hypothetical protein P5228_05860 [Bacteroidales bacterium]|nr:hypothetical protein [Bacteroidales bacterium]HRZ50221.1 hypothetical protein [Bacteroidales bacterium]